MSHHSVQQQQQQQDDDLQSEHQSDSPPPQPLLRPAQGVWSAYSFSPLRKPTSTATRGDASSSSSSRLTRPESAERHSQGGPARASSTRSAVEHPMITGTGRRQSPNPSSRPYNTNYYPNAAYTQPPLNTQLHNKISTSYYRSMSPSSSRERERERERDSDQISQSQQQSSRTNLEEQRESQQQQNTSSSASSSHHHRRHYRHSPSPPTFSRERSRSPLGNPGPQNQSGAPSPSSPTAVPASTTVHSGTSISQIIAATQPGPVVRDGGGGHFQTSQHQRQHSKSPPISSSSRPSGPDSNYKSGSSRPKSASHSSTGMYPFNSLSAAAAAAGMPETGISGNNNANNNNNNNNNPTGSSIPDPNAAEAYTNPTISSAPPPNITSPLLSYHSAVPDHPQPHMGLAQTLTPSLTPALPPVQTQQQAQSLPPQGHTQTQTLTPTITPTSAVTPHHVQQQQHSSPPSSSHVQEIVVLLMEDIRFTGSEDPDFQLAEVSVSLREGSSSGGSNEGSSGPWWADGEEVIKALQLTTGRLEGAAKVYARRGKYRQCFVRIAEDGTMECQPSSLLMVTREKTIELIIEPNFELRPAHDPYSYHRSHTPHPPAAYSLHQPPHLHSHSRGIPSRMSMNMSMPGPGPGAGPSGGVGMSYDDYYGNPTPTSMTHPSLQSHPHPHSHLHSGPPYTTHMGPGPPPPQYYSGGGGTTNSPTFGHKRSHEDDPPPNKRLRTGAGAGNGNNSGAGGGGNGGGNGNGSVPNQVLGGIIMDMNTVTAMAVAQSGSSTTPVESVNPGPPGSGSSNNNNPGNTSNPSSNRNRAGIGMGLPRPGSRGGVRGNTSSPGNPGSNNINNGGGSNNSGLSGNPLSVNIGVRPNPLGLGNVASGQLRGTGASASTPASASGSGAATPGPSIITSNNAQQRPSSPEDYTPSSSTQVFPPTSGSGGGGGGGGGGSRMNNNPTFVNHQGGKAPKEIINAAIVAYLRSHIQNEEGYMEFAASKGRLLPIPELLRGYRFAARIVTTWANRKTPPTAEGCGNKRITKNHVLQALFRQTSWGSDCEQTLQLADKYGPGGPFEDPRVVDILSGGSMLPEKGSLGFGGTNNGGINAGDGSSKATPGRSQGSVALLDFLKDVDKDYKSRSGSAGGGGGGGGKKTPIAVDMSSGIGETSSSSRRTPVITGNPYPSLSSSTSPVSGADVIGGGSGAPPPNNTGSSTSTPTQNPTPNPTPTTSPNLDYATSPGGAGEVIQTQMESGSNTIITDASLAAATVAGIIAASSASTAVS